MDDGELEARERWVAEARERGGFPLKFEDPLKCFFFFSSRRRHTRSLRDWSSDVCSSDLEIFGKCNSPYGHGHNYRVEITVEGPVDDRTGMMVDLAYLDRVVEEEILSRYDHKNLNLD